MASMNLTIESNQHQNGDGYDQFVAFSPTLPGLMAFGPTPGQVADLYFTMARDFAPRSRLKDEMVAALGTPPVVIPATAENKDRNTIAGEL